MKNPQPVVLASSSAYRRQQLLQLGFEFDCAAPQVDESPLPHETASQLAQRLAEHKAAEVLRKYPGALVIGSDQVAELNAKPLGKPLTMDRAVAQLNACSGRCVTFYTAVNVMSSSASYAELVTTDVCFSQLADQVIRSYLERERPLDCAGSFKCEGLGIALFESITSSDPTALVGLPLISTRRLLARHGYYVL